MQVYTKTAVAILNHIRDNASTEYQNVIPAATLANITAVGNALSTYTTAQNEFLASLVNKIGKTVFSSIPFENPFQPFYVDSLEYGDTIEELYIGLINAENTINPDGTVIETLDPFKVFAPDTDSIYHKIDYEINFPLTIKDKKLNRALMNAGAIAGFITELMSSMNTSRKYFDFIRTKKMLSTTTNFGLVEDVEGANDYEIAAALLYAIKNYSADMQYIKTGYNAKEKAQVCPIENQIVVLRNDIKNVIDVEVLASVFNLEKKDIQNRIIGIDNFENAAQICCLLDKSALKIFATVNGETESIRNPRGQYTNFFMHAQGGQSFSLFKNAVMFNYKHTVPEETPAE